MQIKLFSIGYFFLGSSIKKDVKEFNKFSQEHKVNRFYQVDQEHE